MQPCDAIHQASAKNTTTSSRQATVYSRPGCHLCDDAVRMLTERDFAVQRIDIDQDPELRQRFDECVPVVEIGGKIRFRGKVNEVLLNRLVATTFRQNGP